MSQERYAIEARDVGAGYNDELIVDGAEAHIRQGEITCIIGNSGSGKSTLLKAFVGLLPLRRGSVRLLGEELADLGEEARASLLARVGLMFQEGGLLNSLTLAENLRVPLRAHARLPSEVEEELVRMKLGLVKLGDALDKLPGELSGGMKKRAGLVRALMLDPELLLCDEPSSGLDPATQAEIDELILRLRETLGLTVVVVTHDVEQVKIIADRVLLFDQGRITFDGTVDEALASDDETLVAFFGRGADESRETPPANASTTPQCPAVAA